MASNIKLKRSAVQGRVPSTSDLALGELAINTYDGKLYLKKSVNGTESVVDVSSGYSLPIATTSVLGGVKVDGTTITISQSGIISAGAAAYTINRQFITSNGSTTTYNLDVVPKSADYIEVYFDGIYQKSDSYVAGSGTGIKNTFTGNGIQTAFTLSSTPIDETYIEVYLSGVYQKDTTAYSLSSNIVTFTEAVPYDVPVEIIVINKQAQLILSEAPAASTAIEVRTYSPDLNVKKLTVTALTQTDSFNIGYVLQAGDVARVVYEGVYQHADSWTTLGSILTFDEQIPAGDWFEVILLTANPITNLAGNSSGTIAENNDGIGVNTPLDLTKEIHKLSWTGSYAYTLADGTEGQIIQLVPSAGDADLIAITVAHLRWLSSGESTTSTNTVYKPFGSVNAFPTVITGIFTDGAWNFSGGSKV